MKKLFALCGILAPLLYVGTVVVGGLITPNYSHVAHAISELIAAGAPEKSVLDLSFIVYNALIVCFGIGMLTTLRGGKSRKAAIGARMLVATGLLGIILTVWFPMDPRGAEATFAGQMHLVFAGIISLLTLLAVLLSGLGSREVPALAPLRVYSLLTALIIVATGFLAGASAALGSPLMGVAERLVIGAFIQWVFVMGLRYFALESAPLTATQPELSR